jgi:hypothetical protein
VSSYRQGRFSGGLNCLPIFLAAKIVVHSVLHNMPNNLSVF